MRAESEIIDRLNKVEFDRNKFKEMLMNPKYSTATDLRLIEESFNATVMKISLLRWVLGYEG